jgi:hypothetical protein
MRFDKKQRSKHSIVTFGESRDAEEDTDAMFEDEVLPAIAAAHERIDQLAGRVADSMLELERVDERLLTEAGITNAARAQSRTDFLNMAERIGEWMHAQTAETLALRAEVRELKSRPPQRRA